MVDNYANYFCQKLLLSCSPRQRLNLLEKIEPKILDVCVDKKGTHTIQGIIDLLNLEEEEIIIKRVLQGHLVQLSLVKYIKLIYIYFICNTTYTVLRTPKVHM